MQMTSKHAPKIVEEVPWGLYVWEMPNGQWIGDAEGNFLNIKSMKGDVKKIQALAQAARECGVEDGSPVFLPGHRQIDDEEWTIQRQRLAFGLVPDEQDIGSLLDDLEYGN